MTAPTYILTSKISHSEVDILGELKTAALLGLLQRGATEASATLGLDPARFMADSRVWIIRRTRLERLVPIGGLDDIRLQTQVVDFRRARSLRAYEIYLTDRWGESRGALAQVGRASSESAVLAARATTDWVYCDMATGRPVTIPAELQALYAGGLTLGSLPRAGRLEEGLELDLDENGVEGRESSGGTRSVREVAPVTRVRFEVRASHLDHMGHVNNSIYAGFLEDGAMEAFSHYGWPLERMLNLEGALRLTSLDLEYLKDARLGESIEVTTWLVGWQEGSHPNEAKVLQTLCRVSDSNAPSPPLVQALSHWIWRRRSAVFGLAPG